MAGVTVASALLADMIGSLDARGVAIAPLCAAAGLGEPTTWPTRIPATQMGAFWRAAVEATGDPDLGLTLAEAFTPGALDIVGYVMLSSPTALEALERGARLIALLNDGLQVAIEPVGSATAIRLVVHPTFALAVGDALRQIVETILGGAIHQLRLLTGAPIAARAVELQHDAPPHGTARHAALFGVAPRMSAAEHALYLATTDVARPIRSANPTLLAAFDALAQEALAALQRNRRVSDRVARVIVEQLKGRAPTVTAVARDLAMSPRSIQRALAEEGTSYQLLLDAARKEVAIRHLRDPSVTVAHVAWLVGYSEPAAFHRAFRRWTGHPPRTK